MSIRDILVQTDNFEASAARTKFAARLASRFKAHLQGVFLRPTIANEFIGPGRYWDGPIVIPESVVRDYNEALDKAEIEARATFENAAGGLAPSQDWSSINGDFPREMIDAMRHVDLTVFPKARLPYLSENGLEPALLGLSSGGPLIATPDDLPDADTIGRRILVAWDGRREAARALRDAWPLIESAETVSVLIVSKEPESAIDPALMQRFTRHGVQAELVLKDADRGAAGDLILQQAGEMGADLIVMGLFGHTRLREIVLGGASRDLLKRAAVPLFMSH
jgi:nucleotide-binding universal stress UspA family protein